MSVFNDSYVENNQLEPKLPPVKGRLAKSIKFWEGINASPWVLRIIKEGYALPFISEPEPAEFKNNASAHKHSDFVTSKVKELLSSGRIREVSKEEVHVINLLIVADNGNKFRLILDCRYIHQPLQIPKSKSEDTKTLWELFQKDDNFFSNVTLNRVIIILIYLNPTNNIWVLLGKLMAS